MPSESTLCACEMNTCGTTLMRSLSHRLQSISLYVFPGNNSKLVWQELTLLWGVAQSCGTADGLTPVAWQWSVQIHANWCIFTQDIENLCRTCVNYPPPSPAAYLLPFWQHRGLRGGSRRWQLWLSETLPVNQLIGSIAQLDWEMIYIPTEPVLQP